MIMASGKENLREDAILVEGAREERPEAFRRIIGKYQNDIFDLCLRMTGSRQDAEDISQEAFLKLYQHLSRYREGHTLSNWLYTIALTFAGAGSGKRGYSSFSHSTGQYRKTGRRGLGNSRRRTRSPTRPWRGRSPNAASRRWWRPCPRRSGRPSA